MYRPAEQMQDSIDRFVASVFGDSVLQFSHFDLVQPRLSEGLGWQRLADMYWTAENYFHAEYVQKFSKYLKRAHCELRGLVRTRKPRISHRLATKMAKMAPSTLERMERLTPQPPRSVEGQRFRHRVFLVHFWRICHQLLRYDLKWFRYEFSFVADFLLELEKLFIENYGKHHPLHGLAFSLCQVSKVDMGDLLRLGASRTIQVMVPGVTSRNKQTIVHSWRMIL